MNIEVNLNNLTEAEQEQLNALVEKANKSKSEAWAPMHGEMYYFLNTDNPSVVDYHHFDGDVFDESNYAIGNCFKTKEEAEFVIERLKVVAEMKRYIAEHDDVELHWDSYEQEKWFIVYYHDTNNIGTDYLTRTQIMDSSLHVSSEEILEGMIKEIGEDRIKKYYFGVE